MLAINEKDKFVSQHDEIFGGLAASYCGRGDKTINYLLSASQSDFHQDTLNSFHSILVDCLSFLFKEKDLWDLFSGKYIRKKKEEEKRKRGISTNYRDARQDDSEDDHYDTLEQVVAIITRLGELNENYVQQIFYEKGFKDGMKSWLKQIEAGFDQDGFEHRELILWLNLAGSILSGFSNKEQKEEQLNSIWAVDNRKNFLYDHIFPGGQERRPSNDAEEDSLLVALFRFLEQVGELLQYEAVRHHPQNSLKLPSIVEIVDFMAENSITYDAKAVIFRIMSSYVGSNPGRAKQIWSILDGLQIAIVPRDRNPLNRNSIFNKNTLIKDLITEEAEMTKYFNERLQDGEQISGEYTLMEAYTRLIRTLVKLDVRPKSLFESNGYPDDLLWPYIDIVMNYVLYCEKGKKRHISWRIKAQAIDILVSVIQRYPLTGTENFITYTNMGDETQWDIMKEIVKMDFMHPQELKEKFREWNNGRSNQASNNINFQKSAGFMILYHLTAKVPLWPSIGLLQTLWNIICPHRNADSDDILDVKTTLAKHYHESNLKCINFSIDCFPTEDSRRAYLPPLQFRPFLWTRATNVRDLEKSPIKKCSWPLASLDNNSFCWELRTIHSALELLNHALLMDEEFVCRIRQKSLDANLPFFPTNITTAIVDKREQTTDLNLNFPEQINPQLAKANFTQVEFISVNLKPSSIASFGTLMDLFYYPYIPLHISLLIRQLCDRKPLAVELEKYIDITQKKQNIKDIHVEETNDFLAIISRILCENMTKVNGIGLDSTRKVVSFLQGMMQRDKENFEIFDGYQIQAIIQANLIELLLNHFNDKKRSLSHYLLGFRGRDYQSLTLLPTREIENMYNHNILLLPLRTIIEKINTLSPVYNQDILIMNEKLARLYYRILACRETSIAFIGYLLDKERQTQYTENSVEGKQFFSEIFSRLNYTLKQIENSQEELMGQMVVESDGRGRSEQDVDFDDFERLTCLMGSLAWCLKSLGVVLFHLFSKSKFTVEAIGAVEKLFSPSITEDNNGESISMLERILNSLQLYQNFFNPFPEDDDVLRELAQECTRNLIVDECYPLCKVKEYEVVDLEEYDFCLQDYFAESSDTYDSHKKKALEAAIQWNRSTTRFYIEAQCIDGWRIIVQSCLFHNHESSLNQLVNEEVVIEMVSKKIENSTGADNSSLGHLSRVLMTCCGRLYKRAKTQRLEDKFMDNGPKILENVFQCLFCMDRVGNFSTSQNGDYMNIEFGPLNGELILSTYRTHIYISLLLILKALTFSSVDYGGMGVNYLDKTLLNDDGVKRLLLQRRKLIEIIEFNFDPLLKVLRQDFLSISEVLDYGGTANIYNIPHSAIKSTFSILFYILEFVGGGISLPGVASWGSVSSHRSLQNHMNMQVEEDLYRNRVYDHMIGKIIDLDLINTFVNFEPTFTTEKKKSENLYLQDGPFEEYHARQEVAAKKEASYHVDSLFPFLMHLYIVIANHRKGATELIKHSIVEKLRDCKYLVQLENGEYNKLDLNGGIPSEYETGPFNIFSPRANLILSFFSSLLTTAERNIDVITKVMSFCSHHHNCLSIWLNTPYDIFTLEDASLAVAVLSHSAGRNDIPLESSPEGSEFRKKIANLIRVFGNSQYPFGIEKEWTPTYSNQNIRWDMMLDLDKRCQIPKFVDRTINGEWWTLNHAIALLSSQILLVRLVTYVRLRLRNGSYSDLTLDDILNILEKTYSWLKNLGERNGNARNINSFSGIPAVRALILYYVRDYHNEDNTVQGIPFNYDFLFVTIPYILESFLEVLDLSIEYSLKYRKNNISTERILAILKPLEEIKYSDASLGVGKYTRKNVIISEIRSNLSKN